MLLDPYQLLQPTPADSQRFAVKFPRQWGDILSRPAASEIYILTTMLVTVGLFNLIMAVAWLILTRIWTTSGVSTTCFFTHKEVMVTFQNGPIYSRELYSVCKRPPRFHWPILGSFSTPGLYRQCHQVAKPAEAKRTGRECRNDGMRTEDTWPILAPFGWRRSLRMFEDVF